jgi:hypothetical protein
MTLPEFEIKRCEKLVAQFIERRRPPACFRKDVDLAFRQVASFSLCNGFVLADQLDDGYAAYERGD